jgi:hypothetical protein
MANTKKVQRPQAVKVRSQGAKELTLSRRGNEGDRIPSGKVYNRAQAKREWM